MLLTQPATFPVTKNVASFLPRYRLSEKSLRLYTREKEFQICGPQSYAVLNTVIHYYDS